MEERTSIVIKLSDEPYLDVPAVLEGLSNLFPSIAATADAWLWIWLMLGGRTHVARVSKFRREFPPEPPRLLPDRYGQYVLEHVDSGMWEPHIDAHVARLGELEGEYMIPQRARYEVVTDREPPVVKLWLPSGVQIFISKTVIAIHIPTGGSGGTAHRVLAELSRHLSKKPLLMGPEPEKLYVNSPDLAGEFMMPDD